MTTLRLAPDLITLLQIVTDWFNEEDPDCLPVPVRVASDPEASAMLISRRVRP
jgi:hypothetical protein